MITKDEAAAEYTRACEALERCKIAGKPQYILDRLQAAINFWRPKMVEQDKLINEVEDVMRTYSEAKKRWDVE